jgi:hypothetical protein
MIDSGQAVQTKIVGEIVGLKRQGKPAKNLEIYGIVVKSAGVQRRVLFDFEHKEDVPKRFQNETPNMITTASLWTLSKDEFTKLLDDPKWPTLKKKFQSGITEEIGPILDCQSSYSRN